MSTKSLIWVIEAGVYGSDIDPLRAEIRRQGMQSELVLHRALLKGPAPVVNGQPLLPGDNVLAFGTFPFARQIQLHSGWVPGAWCNPVQLDCATYYPLIEQFLFNRKYEIITGAEAVREQSRLFEEFGRDGKVFTRPTECGKTFVGRCIDKESFASALGAVKYDPAACIVVARPIEVGREWRLLVCGNTVVSSSQYAAAGERVVEAGCPKEVREFEKPFSIHLSGGLIPCFFSISAKLKIDSELSKLAALAVPGFIHVTYRAWLMKLARPQFLRKRCEPSCS